MELIDLKKEELLKAADAFGVDVKPTDTKKVIVDELVESGIDIEAYNKFFAVEEDDSVEEDSAAVVVNNTQKAVLDGVLMKMTRANASYEVRGYKFTREHPFAVVDRKNADWIFENERGFVMATPKEAESYYG